MSNEKLSSSVYQIQSDEVENIETEQEEDLYNLDYEDGIDELVTKPKPREYSESALDRIKNSAIGHRAVLTAEAITKLS